MEQRDRYHPARPCLQAQALVQDLARTEERVAYLEQELARAQAQTAAPAAERAPADPAVGPPLQDQLLLKVWPAGCSPWQLYCLAASGALQHARLHSLTRRCSPVVFWCRLLHRVWRGNCPQQAGGYLTQRLPAARLAKPGVQQGQI